MKQLEASFAVGFALCGVLLSAKGFDAATMAFYPFKDGTPGTSAMGVTITNAVNPLLYPGRVARTGSGDVFFSSERPGRYIFTNLTWGADCVYENPGSLYFPSSTTTNDYATLFIEDLVKGLNQAVADAGKTNDVWKIEFFYKLDSSQVISKNKSDEETTIFTLRGICDLYTDATTVAYTNCDASARFYDNGAAWKRAIYLNGYSTANGEWTKRAGGLNLDISSSADKPKNGRWHYISISSANGSYTFSGRPDYMLQGNGFRFSNFKSGSVRPIYKVLDPDGEFPLAINPTGGFRGWISCLKVTKSSIGTNINADKEYAENDNIYASDLETCTPRTLTHLRFEDGVAGTVLSATVTNVCRLADVFTNMTCYPGTRGQHGGAGYGNALLFTATGASAIYTNDVKRPLLLASASAGYGTAASNLLSAAVVPDVPSSEDDWVEGSGIMLRPQDRMRLRGNTALTFEFFARFDYNSWKARVADAATANAARVQLFFMPFGGGSETSSDSYSCNLRLYMDLNDIDSPKLGTGGWGLGAGAEVEVPGLLDGKWHHYAFSAQPYAEASTQGAIKLYFDYEKVLECETGFYNPGIKNNRRYMHFMRGMVTGNSPHTHGFMGEVDEIRISCGLLGPDDFLRQRGGGGLRLFFR